MNYRLVLDLIRRHEMYSRGLRKLINISALMYVLGSFAIENARAVPPTLPTSKLSSEFSGAQAYQHLTQIVTQGQRYYGAPQRPAAIESLTQLLKDRGAETSLQTFTQRETRSQQNYLLTNIVGRFYPNRSKRILLGSHWDTRLWAEEDANPQRQNSPITGANDGSSGIAVLIEIARLIPLLNLKHIGVDLVFFDGEEFGRPGSQDYCAGSRYFADHLKHYYPQDPPFGVIIIDMVGDHDLSFPPELSSVRSARDLTSLVWREGVRLKLPAFIKGLQQSPRSSRLIIDDHTPFQKLKIPAILMIDLDYPHWHTHQDTMKYVSAESLEQTGKVLTASLQRLDSLARSTQ